MAKTFGSATAFKASFETRLRKVAAERAVPFSTLQLKFVMERLLARLFQEPNPPWVLKDARAQEGASGHALKLSNAGGMGNLSGCPSTQRFFLNSQGFPAEGPGD